MGEYFRKQFKYSIIEKSNHKRKISDLRMGKRKILSAAINKRRTDSL